MRSKLLCVLIFFVCHFVSVAQAPSWQWAKEANSASAEQAWDVAYDNFSGSLFVGGTFSGNLSAVYGASLASTYGSSDGFIAKYDQLGNVLWAIKIGGSNAEEVKSVAADDLGNVYVTGSFRSVCDFDPTPSTYTLSPTGGVGNQDGFLAKYTASGSLVWATKFGNSSSEDVWRMHVDGNGIYFTGSYVGNITFQSASPSVITKTTTANFGGNEFYGAKYDFNGVVQWVISGGSLTNDIGFDVTADNNNVYFIGNFDRDMNLYNANGTFASQLLVASNNKFSAFVVCYDIVTGAYNWGTNLGSATNDVHGGGITQDNSNLYITGHFNGIVNFPVSSPLFIKTSTGNNDIYLAKLVKSTGVYQWVSSQTGVGTGDESSYEVVCDAAGNINLAGFFTSNITFTNGTSFNTLGNQDIIISSFNNAGNLLWASRAGANGNDIVYGMTTNTTGGVYVAGSHDNATVFGAFTLTSAGSTNIYVAKTGCETVSNNTIAATQTICTGSFPATIAGSTPSGSLYVYSWQQSSDNNTWTAAAGTNTNQNYSPPVLLSTTYYRRNVLSGYSCVNGSVSNTVTVVVNENPDISFAGLNQTLCISTPSTLLSANVPTIGSGSWTVLSGSGSVQNTTLSSSAVFGLGSGTNTLMWTIANGSCPPSQSTLNIIVNNLPGPALAGSNQVICSSTAALSASTPTAGTGLWTLIGGSGSITNLASTTTSVSGVGIGTNIFLWTVTNGVCAAAISSVSITRDVSPVSNAGINQTICAVTASLAAVSPTVGTGAWSLISGNATLSAPASPSSALTSIGLGANVFIWTVNNGVCPSATAAVTVYRDALPIANAGSSQTICTGSSTLGAVTQTFGIGIWSVIAGTATLSNNNISNPNVTGISTGTNTFLWTVSNGVCPSSTAAVSIYRDAQPLANAGSNQTICAGNSTLAAITQTFGTGVWSVVAGSASLSNNNISNPNVTGISTGTNTFLWSVSNGVCPISTAAVSIYRDAQPIANAGISQTICTNSSTLAAITQTFGTGVWSVVAGSASLSNNNISNPNVTGISTGTNTFLWTVSNGVCPTSTAAVSIYRDAQPLANAGSNQTICAGNSTLAAITQTFGTGVWSVVAGSASLSNNNISNPNVTGISTGTNTFLWTVSNGVCPSSTAAVSIYRDAQSIANAGSNQTICAGISTLTAITQTFGTGVWSVVAGSASLSNNNISNPNVSGISTGTNTFLWTVSNGVCPSATAAVSIYRDAQPLANAGSNQTICAGNSTLAAITQTFGTGVWSVLAGSASLSNNNISNPNVTGINTGTNTFLWTVSNGVCPSSTAAVSIFRDAQPIANAGISQTICTNASTLAAITQTFGTGVWSVVAGSASLSNNNISNPNVTGISTGTNTFLWTVSNGVCPSSTAAVSIYRDAQPVANAGSNQIICAGNSTLAAITQTFGTGVWSVLAGSASLSNNNISNPNVTGISTGTNTFLWTVSNGVCPTSTAAVSIYRDAQPIANAGSNQTVCTASSTLSAITQSFGTGFWTVTQGSSLLSNNSIPNPIVSGISTGTNTFLWTVTNGVCPSSTAAVIIIRDNVGTSANAGTNQVICANSSTLMASLVSVGSGTWSTNSAAIIGNPYSPTTAVTGITTGTSTFIWTVVNGVCPSSTAAITITRDALPSAANVGSDQTICTSTAVISAVPPTTGVGAWSTIAGPAAVTNSASVNSLVSGIVTGTNTFLWTVTNGVCPSSTAAVNVYHDVPPIANAGPNQTVCASNATLGAIIQTLGTGTWSLLTGSGSFLSTTSATTTVSSLNTGSNTILWLFANGVCPNAYDTVLIYRDPTPIANAGANQTICSSTATLSALTQTFGTGTWSVIAGTSTLSSLISPTPNVTGIGTGTNIYVWTVAYGVCPNSTSTVTIVRDAAPLANAGSDQTVCAVSATLSAIAQAFGAGTWSVIAGSSSLSAVNIPSPGVVGLDPGANIFLWTASNGVCPTSTDLVTVYRDDFPIANAGADQTVCAVSATLSAITPSFGSGSWSTISGTGTLSASASNTSILSGLSTGANTVLWSYNNGVCPTSTDVVVVYRDDFPVALAGSNQTVCSSSTTLAAITQTFGTGSWSVLSGPAVISGSGSSVNISGLGQGINAFLWTAANGVCPVSTNSLTVYRDLAPIANAGSNQTLCAANATLAAVVQTFGTGTWSVLSGNSVLSNSNIPNTSVNALSTGANVFQWSVGNGICPVSTSTVLIFRDAMPSTANAGPDQVVCSSSVTINATVPVIGSGTWSVISGTGVVANPSLPNSELAGISTGMNAVLWTVSNGVCPPSSDTLHVRVDEMPTTAFANKDQAVCSGSIVLAANKPLVGTSAWRLVSGTAIISDSTSNTASVSSLSVGVNIFRWVIKNGVCPVSADEVIISRDAHPSASSAGVSRHVEKPVAELSAESPSIGVGSWSIIDGLGIFGDTLLANTTIKGLAVGNNVLRWTVRNGVCAPNLSEITIYVDALKIPTGFSPNGDGINDTYVVPGIDYYEQVRFSVYNRWGGLVYQSNDYKNDWGGTNMSNEPLADDTYYYVIKVNHEMDYSGYVILKAEK